MKRAATRLAFIQVALALGGLLVIGRAFVLQVAQHDEWEVRAQSRNVRTREIPPTRGTIRDRDGLPLAASFEAFHISVSVNELDSLERDKMLVADALGFSANEIERRFEVAYPYFYGPYDAHEVLPLRRIRGVHLQRVVEREGRLGDRARPFVGRFSDSLARGVSGVEAALDSVLRGQLGEERLLIDGGGRWVPLPDGMIRAPTPGHDVFLTIDHQLQGIAEGALREAVNRFDALGGDVVVTDVLSGEILAIASLRTPRDPTKTGRPAVPRPLASSSAIVEPYEPGSTAKIFTAAAMLAHAADTTPVSGHGGEWRMEVAAGRTRTIRDTHKEDSLLTLGEAIKFSSNIAMSQFALRLAPENQYRMLRAFGFGTQPGTGFPAEAGGLLVPPAYKANLKYTVPSWAQGYEFSTSSLQLAMAYGAIANGGVLMAPTLVREVRSTLTDELQWRHRPDTVRRVVSEKLAEQLMGYLALVTDSGGTGTGAQLDFQGVVGKTGTSKLDGTAGEAYLSEYRGSFAAIFPSDAPRFVVFVMIDQPGGDIYYGGEVAAPVVKSFLQQALALPDSPLEVARLTPVITITAALPPEAPPLEREQVTFPVEPQGVGEGVLLAVPSMAGMSTRSGVNLLTRLGFEVSLRGTGVILRTAPIAGDSLAFGSTVTIYSGPPVR